MNPLHYPSLELCKKLTLAGFPDTEMEYTEFTPIWNFEETEIVDFKKWDWHIMWADFTEWSWYRCPSVMELLDEIPAEINWFALKIRQPRKYTVEYSCNSDKIFSSVWTLPNALAEMYLWLKENKYI